MLSGPETSAPSARSEMKQSLNDGMVNTPVYRTSTVIHPNLASYETRPAEGEKIVRYGRYGTPTTFALEEAIARLEGVRI